MKKHLRTIVVLAALALTVGTGYAIAAGSCCVQPEVNSCCGNTAGSSCCK